LGLAVQVFYCVAVPSTLLLVIQTVMLFLGMGNGEDGLDADADIDELPDDVDGVDMESLDAWGLDGLRIFTMRGIIAFFVVFGWVGIIMLGEGVRLWLTILIAALCGFAMMVVLAYLFKLVMKLRSDGNTDNRNAIGSAGKVYLTIPPSRSGEGKVHLMLQGAYVERDAVTDDETPIPTGAEVIVVGISGKTDLIVKRK
jgi:membrane protein implicated in regulation of membrane protease activity